MSAPGPEVILQRKMGQEVGQTIHNNKPKQLRCTKETLQTNQDGKGGRHTQCLLQMKRREERCLNCQGKEKNSTRQEGRQDNPIKSERSPGHWEDTVLKQLLLPRNRGKLS